MVDFISSINKFLNNLASQCALQISRSLWNGLSIHYAGMGVNISTVVLMVIWATMRLALLGEAH